MYSIGFTSGGAGGRPIAVRCQIYMGAPIGVEEIHLQLETAASVKVQPGAAPLPPSPCSATVFHVEQREIIVKESVIIFRQE